MQSFELWSVIQEIMLFKFLSLYKLWLTFYTAGRKHLHTFERGHYGRFLNKIILILDQWLSNCCLILLIATSLFNGCKTICAFFEKGLYCGRPF